MDNSNYVIASSLAVLGARKAKLNVYETKFGEKSEATETSDEDPAAKPRKKKVVKKKKPTVSKKAVKKTPKKKISTQSAVTHSLSKSKKSGKQRLYCICQLPYDEVR